MAETDLHRDWMVTNIQRLERFFAGRRVYVSGNLLIYYQEGDPRRSVAPDAFVVKNCKPGRREIFQVWKEGRTPNFVLETTSKTTRREDRGKKKTVYAQLGVGEYFLYDPRGDWLDPPLQGYRLVAGHYEPIAPDAGGGIISQELGVRFVLENGDLAMFDAISGQRLLSQEEWAKQETQRAEDEKRRAEDEKQRAEDEKRRAEDEKRRAEDEKRRAAVAEQRAERAEQRAEDEAAARKALEDELARLRQSKRKNGK